MSRKVTLFTGQWADLKLEIMCEKAKAFGYDGLELACWGDHVDIPKAAADLERVDSGGESDHAVSAIGQIGDALAAAARALAEFKFSWPAERVVPPV